MLYFYVSGDLPSMEKAKKIVEKSGECFNWRLSSGCHKGDRCMFKHIPINKSIDSQPWVSRIQIFKYPKFIPTHTKSCSNTNTICIVYNCTNKKRLYKIHNL